MRRHINDGKNRFIMFWGNAILFLVVILVSSVSLFYTHKVLMESAQSMGEEIANSYSVEEEHNLEVYQSLITIGSQYIEGFVESGEDEEFIAAWIKDYLIKVSEAAGADTTNTYAVINGMTIAAKPWENIEEYDAAQKEWYQRTVNAGGEIVFTDVYTDTVYDKPVITIAKECGDNGNVIALDIYPENFRVHTNSQALPEGSFFFVCDSKGNLLYEENDSDIDREVLESSFQDLFDEISSGSFREGNNYYLDVKGKEMSVYYREEANGWVSVFLIPNSYLLENWEKIMILYIVVLVLIFGVFILMWMRQRQMRKERRRINETVHILGNSYYAFYRININKGTYDMAKGSEYVSSKLPAYGDYQDLLNVFRDLLSEETFEEFKESFSLENIHRQIENRIEDFGGDFQRRFGQEWKWVNVRILFSPSLNKEEVVLCFRHVEEEKQQQLKRMTLLEDSLKAANASSQSQKKFFAGISHDMRTPLNVIIGMTKTAEENIEDREKLIEYLHKINYSGKQLLELINNILEVSRVEQGTEVNYERFDLCSRIEKDVDAFVTRAVKERKKLDFSCDVRHREVYGNTGQLDRIMNNLISIAFQSTGQGNSIFVKLNEIKNQKHTKYQIIVSDNGTGINGQIGEQVSLSPKQEKRFKAKSAESLDIELMMVRNLVSLMGGEIDVDSIRKKGTQITIILPFETAEEPVEEQPEEKAEEKQESGLQGRNILLAEDYELNMELATEILEMRGARVTQAWNGKEALEAFEASEEFFFDAVLMDMQMPVMDGCEAAKEIRALNRKDAEKVPIVAVTANAFAEDIAHTMKAGMNAHIAKPIDFEILSDTLTKFWDKEAD